MKKYERSKDGQKMSQAMDDHADCARKTAKRAIKSRTMRS
jgi:hypothetical protein